MATLERLHIVTPTILSDPLSRRVGYHVYLKLENLQPSYSFKIRGISTLCQNSKRAGFKKLVSASGGNAGFAAAYAARKINMPITVILPESTPSLVADRLREEGAEVVVHGKVWDDANEYALELSGDTDTQYVSPFDHPDIWEGHSTLIDEVATQIPCKPDVVIACVGGGGLLNGIVQGLWKQGWRDVPIVVMETQGADCFSAAVKADEVVTIPDITSVAKTLGSKTVSKQLFEYSKQHKMISVVVEDREAINGCLQFADDHRMMVEPSCGATLSAFYSGILEKLQSEGRLGAISNALAVVCGGSAVTLELLQKWKRDFDL